MDYTTKLEINPEWTKYNDLYNEGGDGYNPHTKHLNKLKVEKKSYPTSYAKQKNEKKINKILGSWG